MSRNHQSLDSLIEASKYRSKFSGHGNSKGAAGYRIEGDGQHGSFLSNIGDSEIINRQKDNFKYIKISAAWDNIPPKRIGSFFKKLFRRTKADLHKGVDIDLGCLYELNNGKRGAVQAFGDIMGDYDNSPYIKLSQDERTGDTQGYDEYLLVNGAKWPEIKRILIYVYIYDGAPDWGSIRPQIQVQVPGEPPMIVVPNIYRSELGVCVIGSMENIRNGIKMTNHTEYFPGHNEMDRAFGFGLEWDDGQKKNPL